jgi:hypothetical protein
MPKKNKNEDCPRLQRLKEALQTAGVARGKRDKTISAATGYALGSVRSILSGHASLTPRFVTAVCSKFCIRPEWVERGELPVSSRQNPFAGIGDSESVLLADIAKNIKNYFDFTGRDKALGDIAGMVFLSSVLLPDHELIDLAYQFRKLRDGDSDQLAVAAADERLKRIGITPKTRIKLERISAEYIPGKAEK